MNVEPDAMKRVYVSIALLVALCPALFAQKLSRKEREEEAKLRTVQGVVRDEADNVVEGAVVQLKNTKSLQVRSFITRQDGTYRFGGLNRNIDYELKADYRGKTSDTKTLSVFDDRKQPVINLKLEGKK